MAKLTAIYASRGELSLTDKKILVKTGVLEDIGLDSGSGYDRVRSAKQTVHALGQASMYAFKKTEELVRRATVLAAYKKGIERGMSDKEAIEYAKDINRKANFDYGVHDAPNIFRRGSVLSQIMLQFKKYGIKEMELMWEMTPFLNKNSNVSKKQKALFWGGYYLLAGMFQIPLVGWLDDVMDGLFGVKPTLWSKKAIYDTFGYDDPAVNVATRGVLSLGGIDASARFGLADVMPRLEYRTLFGATLSSPVSAMQALWRGDIEASVRALSPGVANLISAAYGERLGKRNRVQGKYDTATERAIRAIGFQTVEESMASERKQLESYAKTKLSKEKQEAIDDYLEAEAEGEDVIPYARRLRELNVSPKTVQEERKRKKMTEAEIREEKAKEKKKQRKQKEISISDYARQ